MGLFDRNNRKSGLMDEIRCDEPSYLIWKWHPSGVRQGETVRENSIRWGSSLRVKDGEVAVFVYKQKYGCTQAKRRKYNDGFSASACYII